MGWVKKVSLSKIREGKTEYAHAAYGVYSGLPLFPYSRRGLDTSSLELLLEMGDRVFSSGIRPYDGFAKGFSCLATPCNRSFALVCDT